MKPQWLKGNKTCVETKMASSDSTVCGSHAGVVDALMFYFGTAFALLDLL